MKNFPLKLSLLLLTCFVVFALINVNPVSAHLNHCSDGFRVYSGNTREVGCHGVCKKVTNNEPDHIFVPTEKNNEWDRFRTYAPINLDVELNPCITCSNECSSSYCSGNSYNNCYDSDGDGCTEDHWNSCDSNCYYCGDGNCDSGCGEDSSNCSTDCGSTGMDIDLPECPHSGSVSDGIYVKNKECGDYDSADAWKNAGCRANHGCGANCGVMQVLAIARVEGDDDYTTAWTTYAGTGWNRKVEFCKVGNTTDLQTCPSSIYGSEGEVWITEHTSNWDDACQIGTSCKNSGWNWGVSSGYYWGNCWGFGGTTKHCPTCIIR